MPSTCTSHYYFCSLTFDLGIVTVTLLVTATLPERNITLMSKQYICCILPISHMSSKGSDLSWHLTNFSRSDRSSRPWLLVKYRLNKTSSQCQNGTFGEFYKYLGWVLTFDLLFIGQCNLSVHPISPSIYTWLTSNHHCIFTMPSTCTSYYYFGSLTFDLGTVILTLTLLVTAKLPESKINSIPKRYICCILPISRMSLKGKTCYNNTIWIKHHIHAKTVHLVNLANILYKF